MKQEPTSLSMSLLAGFAPGASAKTPYSRNCFTPSSHFGFSGEETNQARAPLDGISSADNLIECIHSFGDRRCAFEAVVVAVAIGVLAGIE